jgi:hypothetical protein
MVKRCVRRIDKGGRHVLPNMNCADWNRPFLDTAPGWHVIEAAVDMAVNDMPDAPGAR